MDLSSSLLHNIKTLQFLSNLHCLVSFTFYERSILPFPGPFLALYAQENHTTLNAFGSGGFFLHLCSLSPENMMPEVTSYIYKVCSLFDQNTCSLPCLVHSPQECFKFKLLTWSQAIIRVETGNDLDIFTNIP